MHGEWCEQHDERSDLIGGQVEPGAGHDAGERRHEQRHKGAASIGGSRTSKDDRQSVTSAPNLLATSGQFQ